MTYRIQAKSQPCSNYRCVFSLLIFMSVISFFCCCVVKWNHKHTRDYWITRMNFEDEKKKTQIDKYNMLTHTSTHIHPIIELTVAGYWNYHIAISFPKRLQIKFWTSNYLCKFFDAHLIFPTSIRYIREFLSLALSLYVHACVCI